MEEGGGGVRGKKMERDLARHHVSVTDPIFPFFSLSLLSPFLILLLLSLFPSRFDTRSTCIPIHDFGEDIGFTNEIRHGRRALFVIERGGGEKEV